MSILFMLNREMWIYEYETKYNKRFAIVKFMFDMTETTKYNQSVRENDVNRESEFANIDHDNCCHELNIYLYRIILE